jgi:hypothetical protein
MANSECPGCEGESERLSVVLAIDWASRNAWKPRPMNHVVEVVDLVVWYRSRRMTNLRQQFRLFRT